MDGLKSLPGAVRIEGSRTYHGMTQDESAEYQAKIQQEHAERWEDTMQFWRDLCASQTKEIYTLRNKLTQSEHAVTRLEARIKALLDE